MGFTGSEEPLCVEVAPGLVKSVKVYIALNLAFTVFFYVNMIGFARVLGLMMHRGMLHSSKAAPKGTLDDRTEPLNLDDGFLQDQPTCSICLEDYDAKTGALKIKACGHVFHRQCLQGWLNVNRNCPICRRDLINSDPP